MVIMVIVIMFIIIVMFMMMFVILAIIVMLVMLVFVKENLYVVTRTYDTVAPSVTDIKCSDQFTERVNMTVASVSHSIWAVIFVMKLTVWGHFISIII